MVLPGHHAYSDIMLSAQRHGKRRTRPTEQGFTLIEILVSLSILAIIAGAIAAAFSVGLATLTPGGPQARLAGAHDLAFLEQILGKDGARAACITVNSSVYGQTPTTCASTTGYGQTACAAGGPALLCFAWPVLGTQGPNFLDSSCDIAVYTTQPPPTPPPLPSDVMVTRTESLVSMSLVKSSVGTTHVDRFDTIQFQVGAALPPSYKPPGETYFWLRSLPITIAATGVTKGAFSQTLNLHPVAGDPDGAAAAITSKGSPC